MLVAKNTFKFKKNANYKLLILTLINILDFLSSNANFGSNSQKLILVNSKKSKFIISNDKSNIRYIQTTNNNSNSTNSSTPLTIDTLTLIMAVAGSVVFIAILVIIIICCCKKKKIIVQENKIEEDQKNEINIEVEIQNSKPSYKEKNNYASERAKSNNNEKNYNENPIKLIDESEIRANINKHIDKSATDRRLMDITDRNYQDNNIQKSFDLEEHIKNNIDNLDDKDEKLHQFLAEPNNSNKRISELDIKKYQENQLKIEQERQNNSNIIPDLISNYTDNHKDFYSDDSRVQNSIAESIDYKYFDHINDDNNIMKLNKEKEFTVKNSYSNEKKNNYNKNEKLIDNSNQNNYSNLNEMNRNNINNEKFFAERNLDNYSSNRYYDDNFKNDISKVQKDNDYKNEKENNIWNQKDQEINYRRNKDIENKNYNSDNEHYEYEEDEYYVEEYEKEEYENEEDVNKNKNNNKFKIGVDGNINKNNEIIGNNKINENSYINKKF